MGNWSDVVLARLRQDLERLDRILAFLKTESDHTTRADLAEELVRECAHLEDTKERALYPFLSSAGLLNRPPGCGLRLSESERRWNRCTQRFITLSRCTFTFRKNPASSNGTSRSCVSPSLPTGTVRTRNSGSSARAFPMTSGINLKIACSWSGDVHWSARIPDATW